MQGKINVTLVDDNRILRKGISLILMQSGAIDITSECGNGLELFALLEIKLPDIVILDLEMPKLNGSKTLNRMVKEYPNVKVIIFSRYYDENLIKDMFNRGAKAYVSKDEKESTLIEAIEKVHEIGSYYDNIPCLLRKPATKDGHYYKLIYSKCELKLIGLLLQ